MLDKSVFCSGILHPDLETRWFCAGIFGILGKEVCPRCGLLLFGPEAWVRPAGTCYGTGLSLCTCSTENGSKGRFLTVSMISGSLRHQFLLWRLWQEALGTDNHFSWIAEMSAGQSAFQVSRLLAERFLLPAGSVAASFTEWF